MTNIARLFAKEYETYIPTKKHSSMVYALLLSALWHLVIFVLPSILQLFSVEREILNLAAANKPVITIQLVAAEEGETKNNIRSTQKRGSIKSTATRQKRSFSQTKKVSTSNNITKKSSYRYSKKIRPKHRIKYAQRKSPGKEKETKPALANFSSSAGNKGDRPPLFRIGSANNPRPLYPYLARKRGWQGRVVLSVYVNQSGFAVKVIIKKGSGHLILDRSAMLTIEKWKFKPSLRGGKKVAAIVPVPVKFVLIQ